MKYYVVADVHGFYTELIDVLKRKGFFEDNSPHKLVVCGDLFDRGKEAVKLQDFILDLMAKDEVVLIRGNHEDLMVELIQEIDQGLIKALQGTHHWSNGTVDTMLQLPGVTADEVKKNPEKCVSKMVKTPFFKAMLPAMVDFFEIEHYIFTHGWIPCSTMRYPGGAIRYIKEDSWRVADEKTWRLARWYNGMEAARQGAIEPGKTIVCGHWHCSYGNAKILGKGEEFGLFADYSPYYNTGVIGLDTCTAITRKINCLVIED